MALKIYTKTGDKGQTSLFGGDRVPKNNEKVEAYGTVDELNAQIGLLAEYLESEKIIADLRLVQVKLFDLGSLLATDPVNRVKFKLPSIKESDIEFLEKEIDSMEVDLPKMKNFILPGGSKAVAVAHIARTVCRRAERKVVSLSEIAETEIIIIQYLNRLSDYLFVLSRFIGLKQGVAEIPWIPTP